MTVLNEKLKNQEQNKNFGKIGPRARGQDEMLTQRLGQLDQKISRYDDILAQKDQQIAIKKRRRNQG